MMQTCKFGVHCDAQCHYGPFLYAHSTLQNYSSALHGTSFDYVDITKSASEAMIQKWIFSPNGQLSDSES
jgi:hypothetical protein